MRLEAPSLGPQQSGLDPCAQPWLAGVGKAPGTRRGPPQGAAARAWCLDWRALLLFSWTSSSWGGALSLGWAHFGEDRKDPSPRRGGWPPSSASSQVTGAADSKKGCGARPGREGPCHTSQGGSLQHCGALLSPPQVQLWAELGALRVLLTQEPPPRHSWSPRPQTHLGVGLEVSKGTRAAGEPDFEVG